MIGINNKGFSLIELVTFIIIGGIILPVSIIAFAGALGNFSTPDYQVKARFIAEAKIEDITSQSFNSLPSQNIAFRAVRGDSTNPYLGGGEYRFGNSSYDNYQWKWIICNTGSSEINLSCSETHNTVLSDYTYYKRIEITVQMPDNSTYDVNTLISLRPKT